ncbi:MAG: hypothetical protein J5I98_02890 [Phaeodactylibacter sp.]|nr:hypothetical protein [Phaeodactylibacter sp.]
MRYFSTPNFSLFFFLLMMAACNKDDEPAQPCPAVTTAVSLQNAPTDGRQLLWAALADEQGKILQEHFFNATVQSAELSAERACEASHNLALMYRRLADNSLQLDYFTRIPPELAPDYSAEQPELLPTTLRITQNYSLSPAFLYADPRFGNTLQANLDQFNHTYTLQTGMAAGEDFIAYLLKDDSYYRYKGRRDDSTDFMLEMPTDSFYQKATRITCTFESGVNEVIFAGIRDKSRNTFTPYYSFLNDSISQLNAFYYLPEPEDFDDFYVRVYGEYFRFEHFADALPEAVKQPGFFLIFDNIEFPNHFKMIDPEDARADLVILRHTGTPGLDYRVFLPADEEEVLFAPLDSLALQDRFPDLSPEFSPATLNYFDWNERRVERYEGTDDYRQLLELHLSEPPLWRARLGYEASVQ